MLTHFSKRCHPSRAAFTLLETAVVLVIIGMLIGGVLEGKSLLHKAELQSVTRDFNKYSTAYHLFTKQFSMAPGDMNRVDTTLPSASQVINNSVTNPTDIWGSAGGTTNTEIADPVCATNLCNVSGTNCQGIASSTQTCNGDGNRLIAGPYTGGALTNPAELFLVWQQLANAKLIDGSYIGVKASTTASAAQVVPGTNAPASSLEGGSYMILSQKAIKDATTFANSPNYFYGPYGTFIIFGAPANGSALTDNEILSPKDAYVIDNKIDDGLPAMGQVMTALKYADTSATNPNHCLQNIAAVTETSGRNAAYNVSLGGKRCNLIYSVDTSTGN